MNKSKWIRSRTITAVQSLALVVSLAAILGIMGFLLGGRTFAVAAIGAVVLLYILNPVVSPLWIMKMYRARQLGYRDAPQLYQTLKILSERAELARMPVLYYLPNASMSAFTAGTPENAAIALSDALLRRLDGQEISAVLAHEVSHIRHNDIRIMGFANLSGHFIQWLSLFGQFLLFLNFPLLLMGRYTISWTAIMLLIFAPVISAMLQLALSRTREYSADLGAADLTGSPEFLASALAKMEAYQQNYLRRFLWPGYSKAPNSPLMKTHPPTAERIRRLLEIRDDRKYAEPKLILTFP
jgi:heat shock protein HtpX